MNIQDLLGFCNQDRLFNIHPQASSQDIASKLKHCNVGALLVTNEEREILGIVSERDVARAFADDGPDLQSKVAADLMTRDIVSCSVKDGVVETMARLNELNIRHIPVLEDGRAVAMLSIRDFEHACKELQDQAVTDTLTGLLNRRGFEGHLHTEHQLHCRFDAPLSVAMFDVDHFKRVNDTYGHSVGDEILKGLAEILRGDLRSFDHVARVGGEEFAILFPHTDLEDAVKACQRIVTNVGAAIIKTAAGDVAITISAGLSRRGPSDSSGSDILKRADDLLYEAKNAGRNCLKTERSEAEPQDVPGCWPASLRVVKSASGHV